MSAAEKLWPEVMDLMQAAAYLGFHPVTLRDAARVEGFARNLPERS